MSDNEKKLKTLKDMPIYTCSDVCPNECYGQKTMKMDLQEAAREWVKELEKPIIHLGHPCGNTFLLKNNNEGESKAQIRLFKHFFNLEDEK